jgi:hypothetical protein
VKVIVSMAAELVVRLLHLRCKLCWWRRYTCLAGHKSGCFSSHPAFRARHIFSSVSSGEGEHLVHDLVVPAVELCRRRLHRSVEALQADARRVLYTERPG